jgi:hypothetical protein
MQSDSRRSVTEALNSKFYLMILQMWSEGVSRILNLLAGPYRSALFVSGSLSSGGCYPWAQVHFTHSTRAQFGDDAIMRQGVFGCEIFAHDIPCSGGIEDAGPSG